MERLYLHLDHDVLKARKALPHEKWGQIFEWKGIQFEYTHSKLMMVSWPSLLPELDFKEAEALLDLVGTRYPFSPKREELKTLCPELIFQDNSNEWVFFGGSFNPWHKGHQACLNMLPQDKLCFILPDRNPLKEMNADNPVPRIIELIKHIKFGKHHYLAPTFLLELQKNPTVTWIEKLKMNFPEQKLSLLMGFDSLATIFSWTRYEDLLKALNCIYVASRLEDKEEKEGLAQKLKSTVPSLEIQFLGHHDFEDLSSTNLRKKS